MVTLSLNDGDELTVRGATDAVRVQYDEDTKRLFGWIATDPGDGEVTPPPEEPSEPTDPPNEPEPIPEPPHEPVPDSGGSLWISRERLLTLPTSGDGWDAVLSAAHGNWGNPQLGELNAMHDLYTLAGAYVAARLNNSDMRTKVIEALRSAERNGGPYNETLRLGRNIQAYVIAASIIGYREQSFQDWLRRILTEPLRGHSSGDSLLLTARYSPNNWGTHARAAVTAIAIFLQDQPLLTEMATLFARWVGEVTANTTLKWASTTYHQSNPKRGINGPGTPDDGGLPEEMRRGGSSTMYGPEGLQGASVQAELLYNAGYTDVYEWADKAMLRAAKYVDNKLGGFVGDDGWQPYIYRSRYGLDAVKGGDPKSMGKNMAWTAWTHGLFLS